MKEPRQRLFFVDNAHSTHMPSNSKTPNIFNIYAIPLLSTYP